MRIIDGSSDVCSSDLAALEREHPELGLIAVTNLGWRHITRRSRRPENVHNSFMLLEAARQMVIQGAGWRQLGSAKIRERTTTIDVVDTLALRANVLFRQRAPGPVQVILRRSEEHTSELQSLMRISYAVFCLKKKTTLPRPTPYLVKKHDN